MSLQRKKESAMTSKEVSKNLPNLEDLCRLFVALKKDIADNYRCSDDPEDTTPGMSVTIGWTAGNGAWDYQTGDNSFSGGAYGHADWAVISLFRRSNSRELAREVQGQLYDLVAWNLGDES